MIERSRLMSAHKSYKEKNVEAHRGRAYQYLIQQRKIDHIEVNI